MQMSWNPSTDWESLKLSKTDHEFPDELQVAEIHQNNKNCQNKQTNKQNKLKQNKTKRQTKMHLNEFRGAQTQIHLTIENH